MTSIKNNGPMRMTIQGLHRVKRRGRPDGLIARRALTFGSERGAGSGHEVREGYGVRRLHDRSRARNELAVSFDACFRHLDPTSDALETDLVLFQLRTCRTTAGHSRRTSSES